MKQCAAVFAITAVLCGVGGRVEAEERRTATPWLADLVLQQDEIMTLEQGHLCLLFYTDTLGKEETRRVRIQTRIQAPAQGVISRDNLVVLSTDLLHEALSDPDSVLFEELPAGSTVFDLACVRLFDESQLFDFTLDVVLPDTPDPADPWSVERQADLVVQQDGKFVWNQTEKCAVVETKGEGSVHMFWVKASMEAPQQDVISRDHFVALAREVLTEVEEQFAHRFFGGADIVPTALECSPRRVEDRLVDVELKVSMTNAELQVEVTETASGLKAQQLNLWTQVFPVPADTSQNTQSVKGPEKPFWAAVADGAP